MGKNPNSITSHNQSLLNRLPSPHSSEKKKRDIEMCRDVRYNEAHLMDFPAFSMAFSLTEKVGGPYEEPNRLSNKEFLCCPDDASDPGLRHRTCGQDA
jgi:hypothetical protein